MGPHYVIKEGRAGAPYLTISNVMVSTPKKPRCVLPNFNVTSLNKLTIN